MSFPRVNPSGWPANGKLTSAQINQIDINVSNALDKLGDTITAGHTITWASGSSLTIATGATVTVNAGGSIANGAATWLLNNSGLTLTGGTLTAQSGATLAITGASTTLQTLAGGRIVCGDNDYPTFSAVRSIARKIDFAQTNAWGITGSWISSANGVIAPAVSGSAAEVVIPLWPPHNGATIESIEVFFTPEKYIASGGLRTNGSTPGTNIAANLLVRSISTGIVLPSRTKYLTSDVAYGSSAPTYGDGNVKSVLVTTSAVVDNTSSVYGIYIKDEAGANAVGSTVFHAALVTYSNIADMRFA